MEECEHEWYPVSMQGEDIGDSMYVYRVCRRCWKHQLVKSEWAR